MEQLYRTDEVAKILGCRTETVLDWVRSGKLRKVYVGEHLLRIPASALDDLVKQAV